MKRKRGNKKGKSKGGANAVALKEAATNKLTINVEENLGLDEFDNENKCDSAMEVNTPSSTGTDQPQNLANVNPDGSIDKAAVKSSIGHMKVKLKTSKKLESQLNSSDAPSQSDTDESCQQTGLERHGVVSERMEDSANSLPELKTGIIMTSSKKTGSIKIKPSKALAASKSQSKMPQQDPQYNKQELDYALTVIKKVMKMDAAEPFNVPVNPIALGIPDYFDVIDTPMDFGTICSNLESGVKYKNSEDVFKDVQYIWENCYNYNNKGDYILDLMRRVKKNFAKYWTAAGLYNGQSRGIEDNQDNNGSRGKLTGKGAQSIQKSGKRHGRRHKSDCLCAICVLKRRRREREENARIAKGQTSVSDNLAQESKQEESPLVESPCGDDSPSDTDKSQDDGQNGNGVEKREEVKCALEEKQEVDEEEEEEDEEEEEEEDEQEQDASEVGTQGEADKIAMEQGEAIIVGVGAQNDVEIEDALEQHIEEEDDPAAVEQLEHGRGKKVKAPDKLIIENPMLLNLCGVLFPENPRSVWRGLHSLVRDQKPIHRNPFQSAIDMFMN